MARGKKKDKVEKVIQMTRSEMVTVVKDITRLKGEAANYSRMASEHKSLFTEKHSFSPKALGILVSIWKLDDHLKQQNLLDEIMLGAELLGVYDQQSLFDRVAEKKEREVKKEAAGEDDKDLRPRFKQESMPLDEAEKKFEANKDKVVPFKTGADYDPKKEIEEAKKAAAAKSSSRKAAKGSPLADPDSQVH